MGLIGPPMYGQHEGEGGGSPPSGVWGPNIIFSHFHLNYKLTPLSIIAYEINYSVTHNFIVCIMFNEINNVLCFVVLCIFS